METLLERNMQIISEYVSDLGLEEIYRLSYGDVDLMHEEVPFCIRLYKNRRCVVGRGSISSLMIMDSPLLTIAEMLTDTAKDGYNDLMREEIAAWDT